MKYLVFLLLSVISLTAFAQVKVGDNPSQIDSNSLLELESSDKVLVLSRLTNVEMEAIQPLYGALVYNIDEKCIFMFEGTMWKSLCSEGTKVTTSTTSPLTNNVGDIWVNTSNSRDITSVWDGNNWIPLNSNPKSGSGDPSSQTNLNPDAGDIYVDESNGDIYTFNGTDWINNTANTTISVVNGLTKTVENTIELGGVLTKETVIETSATNTLAITGLETTTETENNEIVVVDKVTGVLKKIEPSNLIREEEIIIIASEGQIQFTPPFPITNPKHIDVYRNGVRIKFTTIDTSTIELEPQAICYKDDEIRIVQFY